jgi:hypothetical protein
LPASSIFINKNFSRVFRAAIVPRNCDRCNNVWFLLIAMPRVRPEIAAFLDIRDPAYLPAGVIFLKRQPELCFGADDKESP